MEEFLDAVTGGAIWGVGFGLALGLTRAVSTGLRPFAKNAVRSVVGVSEWVSTTIEEGRESAEDLYHEAQAERKGRT